MIRWLLVVLVALLVFNRVGPWLEKFGFGHLPGDLRFKLFGKIWFIPITSSLALSFICWMLVRLL
jgi:Protein of unknown function (DUF2905)